MEPVEVAKALILGKFARQLSEELYSGVAIDKIERYLARDLRVVNREAQQRFVAVIGPGMGIDPSASNVFGTLTPTIDDVLNYTLKAGYALQVGFNYGLVSSEWRKSAKSLYSSSLYALEKVVIEVESKDTSRLDDAKAVAKRLVDGLLSYVDDVYVEFSGHKSYYIGLWFPEPIRGIEGLGIGLGELYRRIGLRLVRGLGKKDTNLIDKQYINAVKLLRVPGYIHEASGKPSLYLDVDLRPAEFDSGIMDRAVLSRGFIISVVSSMVLTFEDRRQRRGVRRVKLGKVEEWNLVIKYMLTEGIKANDGRVRFSYVLGNYCAARRMSLDKCRELHSRLVENAGAREYQRYLEYGYQHPEYLPWPFVFFRGHEWYSVPDVDVFQDVYEALRGRVSRHIEAKPTPKPEPANATEVGVNAKVGAGQPEAEPQASEAKVIEAEPKLEPGVKVEVEPKTEAGAGIEAKPVNASGGNGVEASPNTKIEAGSSQVEAKPSEAQRPSTRGEVDVRRIANMTRPWLEAAGYGDLFPKLEPIIEQMAGFIIGKGVVGKWELWDMFYNSVEKLVGSNAEPLFNEVVEDVILIMEWLGLIKVNRNVLILVGSGAKPSEANAQPRQEPVSEVKPSEVNELKTEPGASEVGVEPKPEPQARPEAKVEGGSNQGGEVSAPVTEPKPENGAHPSGGMATTINIGGFINHSGAPVEAIAIRKSTVGTDAIEAPVRLTTVDAIARGICKTEECLVSARLAIVYTLSTVRAGPVRLRWLEREFKERYPIHYELLRGEGVGMWAILKQLKGLGIATIGDIAAPGGWHPKWLAGLIPRLLEAGGSVSISELVRMVRKSEPDLPNAFEGGLTLSDLVALAVRYLEWRGVARVEGGAVTLVK